jgi:glycosyltransferase involved in cell wall biosynthesis
VKKTILAWCDSPTAITGFGTVANHVLRSLWDTGKYEIDVLGINYVGDFYDREKFPYQITPSRLLNPRDPYGTDAFLKAVASKVYDYIWILNDVPVVHKSAKKFGELLSNIETHAGKRPIVIYYYPVDCHVIPFAADMLRVCDIPVAYMDYGRKETLKVMPELASKLQQISHGVDSNVYRPLTADERRDARNTFFSLAGDKFLIVNVNRNNPRKNMPLTLQAFAEFKKKVPESYLYLHTSPRDPSSPYIDLFGCCYSLGLDIGKDVGFPANYDIGKGGVPANILNMLYNCGDVFLTTTYGEGYGLSIVEAMSAGIPVIAPKNTNIPEFEGIYLYPCRDKSWIDVSGYRPLGRVEDIVEKLQLVYKMRKKGHSRLQADIKVARDFAVRNDWQIVNKAWVDLFDRAPELVASQEKLSANIEGAEV